LVYEAIKANIDYFLKNLFYCILIPKSGIFAALFSAKALT